MSTASNFYIAHTKPGQPAASSNGRTDPDTSGTKPSAPSRTFLLLSSPTTRKHLTTIHTVSGQAAKLSNKTATVVESMIQRVVGGESTDVSKAKRGAMRTLPTSMAGGVAGPSRLSPVDKMPSLPPRRTGDRDPPPYSSNLSYPSPYATSDKPPLPPRKSGGLSPASSSNSGHITPLTKEPPALTDYSDGKPKKWGGIALSAALILSALSESSTRLVDAGGNALSNAVAHKYGEHAGDNVRMAAGTVRNVALVYVDVRGFGRRAIVKKVARGYVKGKINSQKENYLKRKDKTD